MQLLAQVLNADVTERPLCATVAGVGVFTAITAGMQGASDVATVGVVAIASAIAAATISEHFGR